MSVVKEIPPTSVLEIHNNTVSDSPTAILSSKEDSDDKNEVECLDPNGATLNIGNAAIDGLSEFTEHLNKDDSQKVVLSLTKDRLSEVRPHARPDDLVISKSALAPKKSLRPRARAEENVQVDPVEFKEDVVIFEEVTEEVPKVDSKAASKAAKTADLKNNSSSTLAPQVSVVPRPRPKDLERDTASISGESCQFFEKFKDAGINEKALKQALYFYDKNKDKLRKERYISIADYGLRSDKNRFYILDMTNGSVRKEKVSHGSGTINVNGSKKKVGDPNHDGNLNKCHHGSNPNNRKNMTRGGFFVTSSMRNSPNHSASSWPTLDSRGNDSMFMDGLSPGVNEEARSSYVVMHGASYNTGKYMGRSYGCPAFTPAKAASIINTIKEGSLYYSYIPQCRDLQNRVDRQVSGWSGMCE